MSRGGKKKKVGSAFWSYFLIQKVIITQAEADAVFYIHKNDSVCLPRENSQRVLHNIKNENLLS